MPSPPWMNHTGLTPPPGIKLEPDLVPHYGAWKSHPSPANADKLLSAVKPSIASGIKAFGGVHVNPMLRSRAKALALDAFRTYDPSKAALRSHVVSHLQGLKRYAARQSQMLSVPERVALDRQHVDRATEELRETLNREPSTAELADHTNLAIARIKHVRQYVPGFAEGQASSARSDDEEGSDPAVVQADPTAARVEFLYHDLDPINQAIVEHGFGLHGHKKSGVSQIARKLNLSPGAVSQRAARIQAMLDSLDETGVL